MNNKKILAFTLLEVLAATCILSFLILGLYIVFDKTHFAWEKENTRLEQYQKIRGCLDALIKELKSSFISSSNSSLFFRGQENEISFICSSNIPYQKGEYDLKQIQYQLQDSQLIRKVKSNFDNPLNPGAVTVLASGINNLTFSYYDGKKWQSKWDSKKDKDIKFFSGLPQVVWVEIVVRGKNEPPITFSTTVNIPTK